jgi:hypothetical protein
MWEPFLPFAALQQNKVTVRSSMVYCSGSNVGILLLSIAAILVSVTLSSHFFPTCLERTYQPHSATLNSYNQLNNHKHLRWHREIYEKFFLT